MKGIWIFMLVMESIIPVTIIVKIFLFGEDIDPIGTNGGIICFIQVMLLILNVFLTERALKRTFCQNGYPRK